ncbi:MAG: endonuclease MutS2 [Candidatus Eremiobacteraeota bacterium]|nr:endonuclease MutS2 [Candidatus Eremiobacteraeota bacterium]
MDKHAVKVLEYRDVVEIIARKTTNIYGREKVLERSPLQNPSEITDLQAETAEAMRILESTDSFTVGQLDDIKPVIDLAVKSAVLQTKEILQVYYAAVQSRTLKKYLSSREILTNRLRNKSAELVTFQEFEKDVKKAISSDGMILDNASPSLSAIRKTMVRLQGKIHSQMESFIKDPQLRTMLQEPIITRREDRYVVPVKQEFRAQFPGFVLDASASGVTLFMEPLAVLKTTNELKFQQSEEKRQEEKIRRRLSAMIMERAEGLMRNIDFLGHYDALQAAARFYYDYHCILPRISDEPILDLIGARHPLLGTKAVPMDIKVGEDFKGLIITGPNTGGKTVSLKTAGLLTLLSLSGFPIPAEEGSRVGIFTNIFADIGDEQSISQNLSTFSSHLTQIIKMIPDVDERSLILLDELGAGTDPSEGVALASGLLRYFVEKSANVIATTHYNDLKVFASHNSEFKNAAVEFDEETLQPTYKMTIGLPGRSCALKIARRYGLNEKILENAYETLGEGHFKVESLLSEIDKEMAVAKKENESATSNRIEMERIKKDYEEKMSIIEEEREKILSEAREEGRLFIDKVFHELRDSRKEWRKSLKESKKGKKSRDEIRPDEEKVKSNLDEALIRLKRMEKKKKQETISQLPVFSEDDTVKVTNLGKNGKIVHILDPEMALVQIGNIKMEIPIINLEKIEIDFPGESDNITRLRQEKTLAISNRIDIRGTRVEEAINIISKYIDDAHLANLSSIQIVHGKGTGALRNSIREYLSTYKNIENFRDGERHEGGWGVTVVNLYR